MKKFLAGALALCTSAGFSADGAGYDQTLNLQGVEFHVTSTVKGSSSTLRIVPSGLEKTNEPIERTVVGTVKGAEVEDLDANGSPEVYVYVTAPGEEARGSVIGYAANNRKSLSEIYLPPLSEDAKNSKGYRGRDEFAVLEGVLGRRFPVYADADNSTSPTGVMRQLQYKLRAGEAGWVLKLDKSVEFPAP